MQVVINQKNQKNNTRSWNISFYVIGFVL